MQGQFLTDRGRVRDHNEDSGGIYYNRNGQFLAALADGMGGHRAGDVASQMAVAHIQEKWEESNQLSSPDEIESFLSEAIEEMNKAIYDHAVKNEACQGMGTTIVITICTQDFFTVAHVGDSRCYLVNDNEFKQITEDHSLVNVLVKSGQISHEEAQNHPRKNVVLKAVGTEEHVESDVRSLGWDKHDQLLLCSDGLTDKLPDDKLSELMRLENSLKEKGQKMIDLANELGGEDNISVILIQHDRSREEGETAC
ncbi:Stp1/IreP family PP2C-type Ser/Thr phosphatase [Virgibacillus dakarensis]|uniref:protein-serine/threonine phosphatase n=1 Tax=Lentibacillus populi TaxID=1827502 RepID=A0A9W5TUJ6_9BACI|nr:MULTISPECIES: Stp1/IreP family PP2C-type Ser/Thr phosphatase [Bacillaceae]MBT2216890.1 Stp1/IreP family PP2C-type Ser/Thr phosphatase [Virgibacillus dakarensis]MTW85296.1 Stp1/IreP family PP2C-type Ser/Thr phosphatase [Virgibacillus dakarensis]GGB29732.1 protein phosphatase [Lentibacillus populi]